MNQYEAMFLFDPTFAADFEKAKEEIERILNRASAKIVFLKKWEERRLAYEIKGRRRGCYVLTYFNAGPDSIGGIERDAALSESLLRILVVRADDITPERMEQFMPEHRAAAPELRDGRDGFGDRARYSDKPKPDRTPADSTPKKGAPADSAPKNGAPADGAPGDGAPATKAADSDAVIESATAIAEPPAVETTEEKTE